MPSYRTSKQMTIQTPDRYLGRGGEANVYAVNNDDNLVAKIYTKPTIYRGRLTDLGQRTEQKLTAMIKNAPPIHDSATKVALAWPRDILYYHGGPNDGLMAGFTMPKIDMDQYKEILHYYHPGKRRELNESLAQKGILVPTEGDKLEDLLNSIVRSTLTIFSSIHKLGYVIGDVNESNILVNFEGLVAFVDSDSFQVQDDINRIIHRSPVGKDGFLSPRVIGLTGEKCTDRRCASGRPSGHNKSFMCFDRIQEDDNFAIAVMLFKQLMNGVHPLDNIGGSQDYNSKTANHEFPYNRNSRSRLKPPTMAADRWDQLSPNWMDYFRNTFTTDRRYSADEVLAQGHHLAGGKHLGVQTPVSYDPIILPNGNAPNETPAARQPLNSKTQPAPKSIRCPKCGRDNQTVLCPNSSCRSSSVQPPYRTKVVNTQNPRPPRNLQPQPPNQQGQHNRQTPAAPKLIKCPECGRDNPATKIICQYTKCLANLSGKTINCRSCKNDILAGARYCPRCGKDPVGKGG